MTTLKEKLRNLRYRIAYMIAPDWIDDLECRFSTFLCEQTGGMMSKCYYTTEAMRMCAEEHQMRLCDECEKERGAESDD